MIAKVPIANANVSHWMLPRLVRVCHCCLSQPPVPLGIPSMLGSWPVNTWTPTPVRKPTSTEALRKSPMNPSRANRATSSSRPDSRAIAPQ